MHRVTRTFATSAMVVVALAAAPFLGTPSYAGVGRDASLAGADQGRAQVDSASPFYAGYAGLGVGDAKTSADFTVPDFSCGATDSGIATTVYAISRKGEFLAGADLFSYCSDGQFVLDGHVTTSGGQIPIWQELEPGDQVRLSITKRSQGPSTHDVSFASVTRDWVSTLPTNSPVARIEVAQRRMSLDGVRLEPPAYGTFRFTNVVFDDVPVSTADKTRARLVDDDGNTLIATRKPHGDSFRLVSKMGS